MPRARSPDRDKAFELWKKHKGKIKIKEIAEQLGVSKNLISKWKNLDKWEENLTKSNGKKINKNLTIQSPELTEKKKLNKALLSEVEENEALNEKQKLFCLFFVNNHNATQAYLRAYTCTYTTAMVNGFKLLRNTKIKIEIDILKKIKNESIMLEPEDLVEKYMQIAFANMTDFTNFGIRKIPILDKDNKWVTDNNGTLMFYEQDYVNFKNDDQVDGGLIKEISIGKNGIKVKLEDRMKALQWLSDYFNMNPMSKHKKDYDEAILDIRKQELKIKKDGW